jgi:hypothetical protein
MIKGRNQLQAEDAKPKVKNLSCNASRAASFNLAAPDDTMANASTIRMEQSMQLDSGHGVLLVETVGQLDSGHGVLLVETVGPIDYDSMRHQV